MKEIREAVGWAKAEVELLYGYDDVLNKNTKEMLNILIDLAEKVLAVEGKMPAMEDTSKRVRDCISLYESWELGIKEGYNKAIDDCVLAFAGMGLSEEEIEEMLRGECQVRWKEQGYNVVCGHPLPCPKHQKIETWRLETATEIHKAWEGKVRG